MVRGYEREEWGEEEWEEEEEEGEEEGEDWESTEGEGHNASWNGDSGYDIKIKEESKDLSGFEEG